jgi:hypothetical protein
MNILDHSIVFLEPTIGLQSCAFNECACSFLIEKDCSEFSDSLFIAFIETAQSN